MEKKKSRLVVQGNEFYELDLECMQNKREKEEQEKMDFPKEQEKLPTVEKKNR